MSDQVLITTSKLVSLADSVRSHASLSDLLKLPDMPGLIQAKKKAGTYDANGNMLKSWQQLKDDGDIRVDDGRLWTAPIENIENSPNELAIRFANVKKVIIDEEVKEMGSESDLPLIPGLSTVSYPFDGCSDIEEIILPDTLILLGTDVFRNCTGLKTITIPKNVTTIYEYAFENCTGLTEISIPNSVNKVGNSAFKGCTNLTTIHYSGSAAGAPWGATNATVVP